MMSFSATYVTLLRDNGRCHVVQITWVALWRKSLHLSEVAQGHTHMGRDRAETQSIRIQHHHQ
jgi:hypothetical protein